jgi:transglutaminase-like putative cysteine protease
MRAVVAAHGRYHQVRFAAAGAAGVARTSTSEDRLMIGSNEVCAPTESHSEGGTGAAGSRTAPSQTPGLELSPRHEATAYLAASDIIDFHHPRVAALAGALASEHSDRLAYARAAYEYVRDQISHSVDVQDRRVTVSASQTLTVQVGLCFAKTHLLAALLRAHGIPSGFCYQRLIAEPTNFVVHGLLAAHLEGAWRRLDPRGNKPGVSAQFSLRTERLAWTARAECGERDYSEILASPHPTVLAALVNSHDALDLCARGLPTELT